MKIQDMEEFIGVTMAPMQSHLKMGMPSTQLGPSTKLINGSAETAAKIIAGITEMNIACDICPNTLR